ncbi:MAG TPA: DUF6788 family protein [Clostridia bacterium]|nr:DUF6788 family protein [Clostridia bacterium]
MNNSSTPSLAWLGSPPSAYQHLQAQLAQTSWICQGSLVCRPLIRKVGRRTVKKGPYYLWTSKHKGKTVSVALSKAQYRVLAQAIANHRRLHTILERMYDLTFKTVLKKVPGVAKRK